MTQIAAICQALLDGRVLSIMDGFRLFGCSNIPREISRSVEQKFDVTISKDRKDFVSKYGQSGYYYRYRLNHTEQNKEGIEKMKAYVLENGGNLQQNSTTVVREHTRKISEQSVPKHGKLFDI